MSLSIESSSSYDEVKASILRGYQLVPEAYRQRFRHSRMSERQTYIEFAQEKQTLFHRWCSAKEVDNQARLRELILLEEFKTASLAQLPPTSMSVRLILCTKLLSWLTNLL